MKLSIRRGIFETNSSSTHAMTICTKNTVGKLPETMVAKAEQFGWEHRVLETPQEKLNYLYTALIENCECIYEDDENMQKPLSDIKNELCGKLFNLGCELDFNDDYIDSCYIDHGCCIDEKFLNMALENIEDYLLNENSIVITGNDNEDISVESELEEKVEIEKCEVFYKWN